jgi:DNA primase
VLSGDEKTAKYVNSPETPIFTKSKVFFGLDKSKRAILDAGHAVICEGQLDMIACFMGGVQNVVAPQGTAFTEQHARILKRYTDEVVLCFDADNAGQNAAVRALDGLLASGLAVRVAQIPAPHDPDSFIKANGGEAFNQIIKSAPDFFEYYLNRLCTTNDTASDKGRLTVLRTMGDAVNKTGNSVLVDKYAQQTALRLGVMPDAVRAEFKKPAAQAKYTPPVEEGEESFEAAEPVATRPNPQEFWLLKLLLVADEAAVAAVGRIQSEWIQHATVREIVTRRLALQGSGQWLGFAPFLAEFESAETSSLLSEAATEDRKIPNPEQQVLDVAMKLRNQFVDRTLAALTQKVSQPGLAEAELLATLQEQKSLRELKRQPI